MTYVLGSNSPEAATSLGGFFVPHEATDQTQSVDTSSESLRPPRPTTEEIAAADAEVQEILYGEAGQENQQRLRTGMSDVVSGNPTRCESTDATFYRMYEGLLNIANHIYDRSPTGLPGVDVVEVYPTGQPGGTSV